MARRVPLSDPELVIKALEEDGGVILTGFTSLEDLDAVNSDSAKSLAPPDEVCYFHSLLLSGPAPTTLSRQLRSNGKSLGKAEALKS